jgi:hypothetical protein
MIREEEEELEEEVEEEEEEDVKDEAVCFPVGLDEEEAALVFAVEAVARGVRIFPLTA